MKNYYEHQIATGDSERADTKNFALQDYQMQLMLLERQNKKRLLMARQEQDSGILRDPQNA